MADMARPALIALALGLVVTGTAGDARAGAALRLVASDGGALEIRNDGSTPVTFRTQVTIEERIAGRWKGSSAFIRAIATCFDPDGRLKSPQDDPVTVTLPSLQRLSVVRWRGYSCSKQCPATCGFNIYLGPGPFRYVVTVLPGGKRVNSQAFTMPRRPAR